MAVVSSSSMAMTQTTTTLFSAILVVALLLVLSCCDQETPHNLGGARLEIFQGDYKAAAQAVRRRPCDEIYVVTDGETLQSIYDKCGDPFIVEENPHIHDPDDVFPGLVLKISGTFVEDM